ncbi:unnamed protein product [Microthlaspi erraticum]|uniref:DUF4283 domain-containing protein n=1 Tax=Microthlaspi erraticum TaxID=1685480 RepID=A0A6D2KHR9_9BRAS|nr:unnamed protein product [Microthlaspi erraticum]
MAEQLHDAIRAMSLHDDKPVDLPDSPSFRVFDENATSLLGRLLNPDCQPMNKMIEDMSRVWRVYDRVRGIALSRDKFQFIFQREKDQETVLKDRPWSYNNWTMLMDRWIPAPPIGEWGEVIEIAYDPKGSQKDTFIRAHVKLNIADPAIVAKVVNLPTGGKVTIEYAYEKLRKYCFHCFRITHERPSCPFLRNRAHMVGPRPRPDLSPKAHITASLSPPPGFPPLFAELPREERKMALQYVVHKVTLQNVKLA